MELIPLSLNPPLLVSQSPLLSPEECDTLIAWCHEANQRGISMAAMLHAVEDVEGKHVLQKLQRLVHHAVLGMDGTEADYVLPRYLHYPACVYDTHEDGRLYNNHLETVTVKELLPDGLHVDTNNNQQFRHW